MSAYPKTVLSLSKDTPVDGRCFFLMEMRDPYYDRLYQTCKDLLLQHGIESKSAGDRQKSDTIISDIVNEIKNSSIILADISGSNPNVLYEAGIAHSIKDEGNVILTSNQSADSVPFDLKHLRIHFYNREDPRAAYDIAELIVERIRTLRPDISGNRVLNFEAVSLSEKNAEQEIWVATHHVFCEPWLEAMAINFGKSPPVKYKYILPQIEIDEDLKTIVKKDIESLLSKYGVPLEVILKCMVLYIEPGLVPMEFFVYDPLLETRRGFLTVTDETNQSNYSFVSLDEFRLKHVINWFEEKFRGYEESLAKDASPTKYPFWVEKFDLLEIFTRV
jgi:hypothetical protein